MPDSENQALEVEAPEGTKPRAEDGPETSGSAVPETPKSESPEERPKALEYEIIPPKREMPETGFIPNEGTVTMGSEGSGAAKGQTARLSEASLERIRRFAASQTRVYAVVGIGMGMLAGLIVAIFFLHPNTGTEANDMGPVNAAQYGLKGHLTTNWNERLEYQVTIEPLDAKQAAAFAADVNASPKPLSIDVQAKDPFGAVLCGDRILLKYDPRNAPEMAAPPEPGPKATKAEKALAAKNEIARGLTLASLEGQELNREHGKNLFKNDAGPNGQIASISAQGVLPCTRQQYEKVASWGFTSNFPVVAPPAPAVAADTDAHEEPAANGNSPKISDAEKAAASARAKRKAASPFQPIYVEGDDAIAWVDAPNGIIETRGGKALLTDKTDSIATILKGRDFPIPIHYRCDQEGNCTFGGTGTGVHHARLRR